MTATAVNLGKTMVRIRDLVPLVDSRPEGAKLDIPAIVRALTPTQADVIAAVQELIVEGALDATTLRAPVKALERSATQKGEPGGALLAEIEAFCLRTGIAVSRFGKEALNDFSLVNRLRKGGRVTSPTIARVREFMARAACPDAAAPRAAARAGHGGEEPPQARMPGMEPEESVQSALSPAPIHDSCAAALSPDSAPAKSAEGAPLSASPPAPVVRKVLPSKEFLPSGKELADELTAYAKRHGLALWRVSQHLFGGRNAISRIRAAQPRRASIEKIQALLAGDPPAELKAQPAGGPRKAANGGVTGAELADKVEALIEEHGLSKSRVGMHLYGNRHGVDVLRQSSPRRSTVEKVTAFLADPPIDELRSRAPVGDRRFSEEKRKPGMPTGAELAAELDAFIERTWASSSRVSNMLFSCGTGIAQLRRVKQPKPETVEKVRLFIANPPDELFAARRSFNSAPRPAPVPRRDPTARPETPLMDLADRQRLNGLRQQANIKRSQEEEAAKLLDAGVDPSQAKSTYVANQMREIQRRRAEEARQQNPVEQAKLVLQRRGVRPVCSMQVYGGSPDLFMVGSRKDVTSAELLKMAEAQR